MERNSKNKYLYINTSQPLSIAPIDTIQITLNIDHRVCMIEMTLNNIIIYARKKGKIN